MDAVERVMTLIPRAVFLPPDQRPHAQQDAPCPIGHGQTNSQPRTVADMLRLLEVRPGHRVLDVGSGSGWTTALLAELTGRDGQVTGVERVPELVEASRAALSTFTMPWADIRLAAAGVLGVPGSAPYDRILVSAQAQTLPQALVDQLGADGIMVIPVAGEMLRVHRVPGSTSGQDADVQSSAHGRYRFVPLL